MKSQTSSKGVLNLLLAPWAILPAKLLEIEEIYAAHLRGEKIDVTAVEARIGRPLNNEQQGYTVQDSVAVLPIFGVIAKRMNLFMEISGGTSTQIAQRDFQAALSDPAVKAIVLLLDSPGGEVGGTQALADAIFSARGEKPIIAVADGMAASAAYWIGSAADKMYIVDDTTAVGSIGVVATHVDYSQAEAQRGIKVTEIAAGKYKRVVSEHAPLSEEGRATIQDQVDHIYSVFVDAVARNRGVSSQTVLDNMAEGKLFLGKQAIKAGLVDGVSSLEKLVANLGAQNAPAISITSVATVPARASAATPITPKPLTPKEKPVQVPTYNAHLIREAQGLRSECEAFGIFLNASEALGHVVAERAAKKGVPMTSQQLARAVQIEQARLRARGVLVSTSEALELVMRDNKQAAVSL
jgi:signal peptide peptidase SppA